jgi:hypothetical protein
MSGIHSAIHGQVGGLVPFHTAPTMCETGNSGCFAKYSEPSSPSYSSVYEINASVRCGRFS